MNIGELIASIGGDVTPLRAALSEAQIAMDRSSRAMADSIKPLNDSLEAFGKRSRAVGKSLSMYVTAPIVGMGTAAFKMQKDFEASMTKITSLVGISRDQVAEWSDELVRRGPEWAKSPNELAEALFFVTSAGIKGAEAMEVLEMAAKASASGLGETKVVADLVTSAMNAYGKETLGAEQATDVLVAAVREGKAEASELASVMGATLPIASEMGVSFDQVGAAIAAMTRTGTDAATASTQLKGILSSLYKPTQDAEKALAEMGTSSSALRKTIREDGLLVALQDLRQMTSTNEEAMGRVIPNIRALSGVLDLMGKNAEDTALIFDSVAKSSGVLNTAFEETQRTLEFKYQKALTQGKSALTALGNVIRELFLPLLEKMTGWLESATAWFLNLSEAQKKIVVTITAVVAAIGPLLVVMGTIVGKVIPALITGFTSIRVGLIGLQTQFIKLTAIIAANPIGALAVGITAAVTALVLFNSRLKDTTTLAQQVHDEAVQNTVKERVEVEQLMRVLKNEHATREQKEAALRRLNQLAPEHFKNISIEKSSIEDLTKAAKAYNDELVEKAKMQVLNEKLVDLERQRLEDIQKGTDKARSGWQKFTTFFIRSQGNVALAAEIAGKQQVNNAKRSAEAYEEQKEAILGMIDALRSSPTVEGPEGITDIPPSVGGGLQGVTSSFVDVREAIDEVGMAFDRLDWEGNALRASSFTTTLADPMEGFKKVMAEYEEGLRRASVNNDLFGDSFNQVAENIRVTEQAIQSMIAQGFDAADPAVQMLVSRLQQLKSEMGQVQESMIDWSSISQSAAQTIGQSFLQMGLDGEVATSELLKQILAQITGQLISQIIVSIPFPANLAVAAGAGLMAGKLISQIPEFAKGGMVSGPTLAMVGEYPGARHNPEVIAPLDKLQKLISPVSHRQQILTTRISKGDLLFVLQEAENYHNKSY